MQKRGISPLIATILIIGFTIVLGALVMIWGTDFFKTIQEEQGSRAETELTCTTRINPVIKSNCNQNLPLLNLQIKNDGQEKIASLLVRLKGETSQKIVTINKKIDSYGAISENIPYPDIGRITGADLVPYVTIKNKDRACSPVPISVESCSDINAGNFNQYSTITSDQGNDLLGIDRNNDGNPDQIYAGAENEFVDINNLQGTSLADQTFTCYSTSMQETCSLLPYFTVKITNNGNIEIKDSTLTIGANAITIPSITKSIPYSSAKISYTAPTTAAYDFSINGNSCPQITKSITCSLDPDIKSMEYRGETIYYKESNGIKTYYKEENGVLVSYVPDFGCDIIIPEVKASCSKILPYFVAQINNPWSKKIESFTLNINDQSGSAVYTQSGSIDAYGNYKNIQLYPINSFNGRSLEFNYNIITKGVPESCPVIKIDSIENCNLIDFTKLYAFYPLEELIPTNMVDDLSSNNYKGTLKGTPLPTIIPGKINNAIRFQGGTGLPEVSLPPNTFFNPSTSRDWSINFWVKSETGNPNHFYELIGWDSQWVGQIGIGTEGLVLQSTNGGAYPFQLSGLGMSDKNWHYFVLTYNKDTNTAKAYVDSVLKGSYNQFPAGNFYGGYPSQGDNRIFGRSWGGYPITSKSIMDEVAFYDKTLTQEEITEYYNQFK